MLLVGARFLHLTGPIDDPHSWRQCDTAHYSLDFFRNGIDLLRPGPVTSAERLKEIAQLIMRKKPEGATTPWWTYLTSHRRRDGLRERPARGQGGWPR